MKPTKTVIPSQAKLMRIASARIAQLEAELAYWKNRNPIEPIEPIAIVGMGCRFPRRSI